MAFRRSSTIKNALRYACYACRMESISQREMRNRSGEVLRAVAAGDSFTVTNDGVPVARLVPIARAEKPRLARPARKKGGLSQLQRFSSEESVADILDDLRGER